ncbi:Uncharacterized protein dnl_25620 [Desulfonema limicola]|uniref:Uncharacterized protein n=1 Tax=Desulfonema limicola TaxID=45656 RepID=A0A975B7H0_9BACT|nr:hypothetical protein [Desulfonema limicola]QTA80266.1 Uncharacterized protein dnl_25620 [Desulfonema limicola]
MTSIKTFIIERDHVLQQFKVRYKRFAHRADEIIDRLIQNLLENTPDDWRFTESPSSRFFIVEEETGAKFMGMSYRAGTECADIVKFIQENAQDTEKIFTNLKTFVDLYIGEVLNPELSIVHEIRTVYPQKKEILQRKSTLLKKPGLLLRTLSPLFQKKLLQGPMLFQEKTVYSESASM